MTSIAAPTASSGVTAADLQAIKSSAMAAEANGAATSLASSNTLGGSSGDSFGGGFGGSTANGIANFNRTGTNMAAGPMNSSVASQAAASHNKLAGARRCFDVCNDFYQAMGGNNLTGTKGDTSLRNQSLDAMKGLPAGTVVYMSLNPGTDPKSTNLANKPHWMISLGGGKYADNVSPNMSHEEMLSKYASEGRKIDETFPPPPRAANSNIA